MKKVVDGEIVVCCCGIWKVWLEKGMFLGAIDVSVGVEEREGLAGRTQTDAERLDLCVLYSSML